jgi:DNA-binding MarR family transcriptional regulator
MDQDSTECILGDATDRIPQELRIMFGTLVLFRTIEERMDELNVENPLSKPARHMLVNLGVPRRMGQMAEDLNTQPSAVTAVADDLEARGLVARERIPEDRRAWQLRLTEEGEATRRALIETTARIFRDITDLNAAEIESFATLMDKVAEHILKTGRPKGLTL